MDKEKGTTAFMELQEIKERAKDIRLIALDMDGTCLDNQGHMTERTSAAIRGLVKKGYIVVPATGRGFPELRERLIRVPEIRYVVSNNGAILTDGATGERLIERDIPRQDAAELAVAVMDQDATCIHWDCGEDYSIPLPLGCRSREAYEKYFREGRSNDCLGPREMYRWVIQSGKRFFKMGLRFREEYGFEHYEALIARDFPQISAFRSGIQMEIVRRGVNKGVTLKALCAHLGLPAQAVCAMGDNGNDVDMIDFAGLGITVENGIQEAKDRADYIAGANDREGVAAFLEEVFL